MSQVLPTATAEACGFWRLRIRLLRCLIRQAFSTSRLRTILILTLSLIFWFAMYVMFHEGFRLLWMTIQHEATRSQTVHAIYNVFFLTLLMMLTVSSAIVTYGGLFRGRETFFLLTIPVTSRRIVLYRFQETMLITCWGFFLLGSPLLLAYGTIAEAPWYYFVMMLPFMFAFVFIPGALGAILCLVVVRYLPNLRFYLLAMAAAVAVLAVVLVAWFLLEESSPETLLSFDWFHGMLARLQYSEQRCLPSWWLSTGLLEAAHPATSRTQLSWLESLGFWACLTSTAMVAYLALGFVGEKLYVAGYSGLAGLASDRKRARKNIVDETVAVFSWPLPKHMRHLVQKDFRIFRRDITQWSQFAIFFALLAFYFLNIRRLHYGTSFAGWMVAVSFLNVGVTGLLLATFTTRFIYPLVSLEGRRFWILGTLPIDRSAVIWSKFFFATFMSLIPCSALILLSDVMLGLHITSPLVAISHQVTCCALCLGLAGLAVGLGARFPNLREASAAKIAAGFGGTLTLVISVIYIAVIVLLTAVPTISVVRKRVSSDLHLIDLVSDLPDVRMGETGAILIGLLATIILGVTATLLPLYSGSRALRELEH
jgi:ABC-2 type transport system permease protein